MDHHKFLGMASTHEKCGLDLLGQSRAPSFPYFSDWKFDYQSDLKPKETAIRGGIQERLIRKFPETNWRTVRMMTQTIKFYEEYFDHDLGRDEDEYERHYARIRMLKKRKRKLKGIEKGIVHDNDDVISRENHKVLKNKIGGQPLFISHGWIKWG
ncbi:hypothetical protein HID58_003771 [Brassica napus]|uniref:Uncharacterized protein n=1 Tax=Brassica napus TaxID=3708 RepID=A0ABQ8ER30_BRANA|nr:hypothetical protein HID58_003771 [Brassica napus]